MRRLLVLAQSYLSDETTDIAGIHVHRQLTALRVRGWDVRVINPQPWLYRRLKGVAAFYPLHSTRDGIVIWRPRYLKLPFVSDGALHDRLYAHAVAQVVRRISASWPPDLVVCEWIVPGGRAAVRMAHQLGLPLIFKAHGHDVRIIARAAPGRARRYYQELLSQAAWSVCNGAGLQRDLLATGLVSAEQVVNIPIGVDTTFFHAPDAGRRHIARQTLGSPEGAHVWLFVGTWHTGKGTRDLVATLPPLLEQFDDVNVLVLGPVNDTESQQELEHFAQTRLSPERIRFLGPGPAASVQQAMHASDVFVLPSYREGLPSALLEAMASGLVPVVSAVGGIPDVVEDGVNGLLIEAGDQEALTDALTRCATDATLCKRLSQAAQATIHEGGYSLDAVGEALHRLYISTIERHTGT